MIIIGEGGRGQASGRGRKETVVPSPRTPHTLPLMSPPYHSMLLWSQTCSLTHRTSLPPLV